MPEYARPPVVEVALGVMFDPPPLTIAHLGRWWEQLAAEYPTAQEASPLVPVMEGAEGDVSGSFQFSLVSTPPSPRLWFISAQQDRLVQVQRDRLLFNWRRLRPEHAYPRFHAVHGEFLKTQAAFEAFVHETCGAPLVARQYELTYVNHVPIESLAAALKGEGRIFEDLAWKDSARFLPEPEGVELNTMFRLPDGAGRLRVRANGTRGADATVLMLELTARGFSSDQEQWFALAHEWIVRAFADLTTNAAQIDLWGRKS